MTSMTGTDPHPAIAELSALSEGVLPPDRSAAVREHVADCPLCTDVLDSLEEIRGLLGTLPGPYRMPEDVAGRIDAALAAEALLDATRPRVPRETITPHVPRETSSAPHGHSTGSAGPGRHRGGSGSHPAGRRGRRMTRRWLAAASAAGALVLSGVLYLAVSSGGGTVSSTATSDRAEKVTGPAATQSVGMRVKALLAGSGTGHPQTPLLDGNGGNSDAAPRAEIAVPSCVLDATGRSQAPLAADRELFQGTDAYLVVLPHTGDSTLVDAFFVNASCTASSRGTVLFQGTFPR